MKQQMQIRLLFLLICLGCVGYFVFCGNQLIIESLSTANLTTKYGRLVSPMLWAFHIFSILFVIHLTLPIFILLIFPLQRIKDPRIIIRLGERFQKLSLRPPVLYELRSPYPISLFTTLGISDLPRPFASILINTQPSNMILDAHFCRQAVWQNMGGVFQTIVWTTLIALSSSLLLELTIVPLELFFNSPLPFSLQAVWYVFIVFIFTLALLTKLRWQIYQIDFRTIRIFQLNPEEYFQTTTFSWLIPNIEKRKLRYEINSKNNNNYTLPSLSALPSAKLSFLIALGVISTLWLSLFLQESFLNKEQSRTLSPLQLAVVQGDLWKVYQLSQKGVSLNELDEQNQNILFYALSSPHPDQVISYLLKAKINVNQMNRSLKTVLDLAQEKNLAEVEKLLSAAGATTSFSLLKPRLTPPSAEEVRKTASEPN